jgi:RalA-binding protein 1
LGSIVITGAQIGRQQKTSEKTGGDEEKEYRHAFLIVEAKKGPAGGHPRHVLCAESDADRDSWVEMLVRYVMGSYNEEPAFAFGPNAAVANDYVGSVAPRSSTSSTTPSDHHGLLNTGNSRRPLVRGMPRDEMMKTTQLPSIQTGNGASPTKAVDDRGEHSPARSMDPSPVDRQGPGGFSDVHIARKLLERGHPAPVHDSFPLSSSLPSTSSPLDNVNGSLVPTGQRSNSELGHYTDAAGYGRHQQDHFAEQYRRHHGDMSTFLSATSVPNLALPTDLRAPSPEKVEVNGKAKISAPIGGAPIPAGYKFGGKDPSSDPAGTATATERREKAKSRSFWGFGRPGMFLVLSFSFLHSWNPSANRSG